jgi:hypothetical protein
VAAFVAGSNVRLKELMCLAQDSDCACSISLRPQSHAGIVVDVVSDSLRVGQKLLRLSTASNIIGPTVRDSGVGRNILEKSRRAFRPAYHASHQLTTSN